VEHRTFGKVVAALRRQLGVIFQDFVRYELTAGENIGLGQVALGAYAMRAGRLAEDVVAQERRVSRCGFDHGLGQHTPVQRPPLGDDLAVDEDDRGVPAALGQRLPPLAQPVAQIKFHFDAGQVRVDAVLDDVLGQRAFPARDVDLERPPGARPAEHGDLDGIAHSLLGCKPIPGVVVDAGF